MKASISAFVLAGLLLGGRPARAQDSDRETKKKIMQALEKGVDALLKFKRGSERAFQDLSKAIAEKLKSRERPKPPMPVPPQPPPPREEPMRAEPRFVYDHWAAWNSFEKGAWVEQETVSRFGDMPESKMTMKTVITSKSDTEVKGDRGEWMKDLVLAARSTGGGAAEDKCKMPGCEKKFSEHKKPETKNGTEEIEVAGKKLKCDAVEMTGYDCKGEKQLTSKTWYSKVIPGWAAKSEFEWFGQMKGTSRSVVTAFGTK